MISEDLANSTPTTIYWGQITIEQPTFWMQVPEGNISNVF